MDFSRSKGDSSVPPIRLGFVTEQYCVRNFREEMGKRRREEEFMKLDKDLQGSLKDGIVGLEQIPVTD
ncbi:unnamed protein product [Allacma fusca]|uniref:Uncharacterized protein n=1 Tax=Allacma fusca TaxID=39272 RepID=A0A8J2NUE2_9HEXA|nr:unnamed protein product [Allacma fusca]